MANRCRESVNPSAVNITCSTTKCDLARSDTAEHITEIFNGRATSLYQVEICAMTLNKQLDIGGQSKSITQYALIGKKTAAAAPIITRKTLRPISAPATEEIQTRVEYYDATQRVGNKTFLDPKEKWLIEYEMAVL